MYSRDKEWVCSIYCLYIFFYKLLAFYQVQLITSINILIAFGKVQNQMLLQIECYILIVSSNCMFRSSGLFAQPYPMFLCFW